MGRGVEGRGVIRGDEKCRGQGRKCLNVCSDSRV